MFGTKSLFTGYAVCHRCLRDERVKSTTDNVRLLLENNGWRIGAITLCPICSRVYVEGEHLQETKNIQRTFDFGFDFA